MSAGIYEIVVEQKATFSLPMTWLDSNNNPINLTGYTAQLEAKDSNGAIIVSLTTSNGGITLGGAAGTITLALTATQTTALAAGTFNYDLLMTSGSTVTRLLQGSFTITQGVTP